MRAATTHLKGKPFLFMRLLGAQPNTKYDEERKKRKLRKHETILVKVKK